MKKTVLLFDMDGVLVEPRRYRASLQSTMDFFGRIMGWNSLYPGEDTIAWFEAKGIISEWDIAPLFIAGVVETVLEFNPNLRIPADLISFCEMVKAAKVPKPEFNIEGLISQLPNMKKSGYAYCDLVLYLIETGPARLTFNRLGGTPLLNTILQQTRNVHQNLITRVFQEVFLGQTAFENTFHLPAINFDRMTQRIVDRQLISPEWNEKLKSIDEDGSVELAIMTARPSAVDYPPGEGRIEFSPEADIIVNQLGWEKIPVIGQGQLQYAADQLGCFSVDLIKPSPVHVLGAIGLVIKNDLLPAVQAGWNLLNNENTTYFNDFPELDLHIFEDSPVGIRGAKQAMRLLESQGIHVRLTNWGISTNDIKTKELLNLGAVIVPTINEALEKIDALN